jgi:hypothetical protein
MSPTLKKIFILVLVAGLMFVVYTLTSKPKPLDPLITSSADMGSSSFLTGVKISQALLLIEQITLPKDIFTNPIYQSLQDRSTQIEQEQRGRVNPFAPLGAVSSISLQSPQVIEQQNIQISNSTNLPIPTSTPTTQPSTTSGIIVNPN